MCTPTLRVVCIANIPPSTSVDELLNLVHFGPIESIRLLPEKDSIFLAFLDASTAADFFADALRHRLTLDWHRLTLGWGHPSSVPPHVNQAVTERGATRHVYLEDLEARLTKDTLRHELTTFGPVEQIKLGRDRDVRVASVHFLTINDAMKAMKTLHGMCERVEYRQDRCGSWPTSANPYANPTSAHADDANSILGQQTGEELENGQKRRLLEQAAKTGMSECLAMPNGNRTLCISNITPTTTREYLCNVVRGGMLQNVRLYTEGFPLAYITFVDPIAAFTFFQTVSYDRPLTIHDRRLSVSWGKHSGALPAPLAHAIQAGATRTVHIGNIQDFDLFNAKRLEDDWEVFGRLESVHLAKGENCAFVNFANIANAVRAVEMVQNWPEYASLRFAFGMDRCADPINSAESISGIDGAGPGEDSDGVQVQAKGAYADAEAVEVKLE
ncbi:hypothetical protein DFH09DRAFT_931675 [Mycena vulgaris]|nr:hypothetical protein DFH09DRAFT_931675 [Mycena vulgaris]